MKKQNQKSEPLSGQVGKNENPLIDDAFFVKRQRWGTFVSYSVDEKALITSLTEDDCINATRWYLKAKQEGFTDNAPTYDSFVGGKL